MEPLPAAVADDDDNAEATVAVDAAGVIRRANVAALELLGYARDELVGLPLTRLLPERLRELHAEHVARFFRSPHARHLPRGARLVALHRSGAEIDVDISLVPCERGGATHAVAVLRPHDAGDVERELRERLDFEALIADVTALVVVATPQDIEQALLKALDQLRLAIGADRAVLIEYSEDWTTAH